MKPPAQNKGVLISSAVLSRLLNCSGDTLAVLERQGIIKHAQDKEGKTIRGRWDLQETVPAAVQHYRGQRDAMKAKLGGGKRLEEVKHRKLSAEAAIAELKFQVMSGSMLPTDVVDQIYVERERTVARKIGQISSNCAKLLYGMEVTEIETELDKQTDSILRELDEIDRKTILRLNKEFIGQMDAEGELIVNNSGDDPKSSE